MSQNNGHAQTGYGKCRCSSCIECKNSRSGCVVAVVVVAHY